MDQALFETLIPVTTGITYRQKLLLDHLVRLNPGKSKSEFHREALDLLAKSYGVTDEQIAAVS